MEGKSQNSAKRDKKELNKLRHTMFIYGNPQYHNDINYPKLNP